MVQQTQDPWDVADSAEPRTGEYFGQCFTHAEFVYISKGEPKEPFNPAVHNPDKRRTEIEVSVVPLPEHNLNFAVEQQVLDFDRRWVRHTLPSLKELGSSGRAINGRFVRVTRKPTGRKYRYNGEEREEQAIIFLEIYDNEDACRAAFHEARGETHNAGGSNGDSEERELALAFLPPLVKQAGGNVDTLKVLLDKTPMVGNHFGVDSPEVQKLLEGV